MEVKKAVVFFIGGAADKESYYFQGPNNNVADAQILLDTHFQLERQSGTYESHHLGYSDVRGIWDIDSDVKSKIASKAMPVYLIGHSLGGWNGAHLAEILTDDGYNVEVLVTLDPVGKGFLVWLGSDIYVSEPTPKAKFWINISADAKQPDSSDNVAEFGERWVPQGANISVVANINHLYADRLFKVMLPQGFSALEYIKQSIQEYLAK